MEEDYVNTYNLQKLQTKNSICDVCKEVSAEFYSFTLFIHVCSEACLVSFLSDYVDAINIISPIQKLEPSDSVPEGTSTTIGSLGNLVEDAGLEADN